jgi:hypothetical protein
LNPTAQESLCVVADARLQRIAPIKTGQKKRIMTKPSGTICTFIITLLAAAACFADNAKTLSISGAVTTAAIWDVPKLKQQFSGEVHAIQYSLKGKPHTSNCVSLLSVLNAAGIDTNLKMDPKADPKTKHRALRLMLVVRARRIRRHVQRGGIASAGWKSSGVDCAGCRWG